MGRISWAGNYYKCIFKNMSDIPVRRLSHFLRTFNSRSPTGDITRFSKETALQIRLVSSESGSGAIVKIGDVTKTITNPKYPEYVPARYLPKKLPQTLLKHLQWMIQKDNLGQDIFLIGPPGPMRRQLAMMYAELTKKEVEYVSLSRDTTETDLKQRREIVSGTAYYIDQCAVRAATEGRILVLEGIEKTERNVLPVLNNLLENREMQLEDGRFLTSASRYDHLMQTNSVSDMEAFKLIRVHEDFRVIALGLPVPRYQGNPLDPPLRSRFQARDIPLFAYQDVMDALDVKQSQLSPDVVTQLVSIGSTLKTDEANSLGLPDFPLENLPAVVEMMSVMPGMSLKKVIHMLYPYEAMLSEEGKQAVLNAFKTFVVETNPADEYALVNEIHSSASELKVNLRSLKTGEQSPWFPVSRGTFQPGNGVQDKSFVTTPFHDDLLASMMLAHSVKDFCIIGPRGCGKSVLVDKFCESLGYHSENIMLYQDMTARDLLQQRMTLPNGDTAWRHSPLVTAALEGSLAVLDGLHRVNPGTFAVLHRLIHDRELLLSDGSRLYRHDRYEQIKQTNSFSDNDMQSRNLFCIHPSFRMVALAEPPVLGSTQPPWLNSEMLTNFVFLHMRGLSHKEELHVLKKAVPNLTNIQPLFELANNLRTASEVHLKNIANSLSLRQLLRLARRLSAYPHEHLYHAVNKACLTQFLPRLARTALEEEMSRVGLKKSETTRLTMEQLSSEIKDGKLRIGETTAAVYQPNSNVKVPDVLFYENQQHLEVMEDMLKDFMLGEHLLLVGNQGVGKNKIVDRFLHLLNRPREYIQLHRDTTVQTLTLQPSVRGGVLVYEDSPLVKAAKYGHVLVIDEADKAPTNVTCILKTLVESGEMHLSDGRRIVSGKHPSRVTPSTIVTHPDFRMIVLANRPGFPFLGNDFFSSMGDIFSCYAINNPDVESEMFMLRQYGPDVPEETLKLLVSAFGELRDMADQGLITYPYSTREVVNIVKHMQRFPDQGMAPILRNVFDFDLYNKETTETIITTLHKHGIPIGANPRSILLSRQFPLPDCQLLQNWTVEKSSSSKRNSMLCPVEDKSLSVHGPVSLSVQKFALNKTEARSLIFTEQESFWTIPLHETSTIADVAVTQGKWQNPATVNDDFVHVATISPVSLYTMNASKGLHATCIDLYDLFPSSSRAFQHRPRISIAALGFPLHSNVVMHEGMSNILLDINWDNGQVRRLELNSAFGSAVEKITRNFRAQQGTFRMCSDLAHLPEGLLVFYRENGQSLDVLRVLEGHTFSIGLPVAVGNVQMVSRHDWLVTEYGTNKKFLLRSSEQNPYDFSLSALNENVLTNIDQVSAEGLHNTHLSHYLKQAMQSPNRVLATPDTYFSVGVGLPDLSSVDLYGSPRSAEDFRRMTKSSQGDAPTTLRVPALHLPESGQLVRALPTTAAPKECVPEGTDMKKFAAFLEVVDPVNKALRYIPVPAVANHNVYHQWYVGGSDVQIKMAPMSNDAIVTVDSGGSVMLWETSLAHLDASLRRWQNMIGGDDSELQLTQEKESGKAPEGPKHGRVDPTGAPHVGGNQWAGGTGGRDTAGLGGIGGPYRLDAGHDVTQVPQWEKDNVPEEVRQAARGMAKKAWKQRLKEIEMSEYDGELYDSYLTNVQGQVKSLRVIIESLQAKSKERQWLKNQTYGDLDESKLVEGLVGEKAVYRRRGEKEPELGTPQQKPKLVQIICDVSGSMYRFNGYDGRMERQLEAILMVMEACKDYEEKVKYEIKGHSGEGFNFEFSKEDKPPKNNKHRLDVLKSLHAHSQFCISGDSTLEAARHAIKTVTQKEADEHFVIILSDANFDRYGIRPQRLAEILSSDEKVNAFVIFIGSLGDQAVRLVKQLPSGKAFLCLDNKQLPNIMQQIFTSTILQ